MSFRWSLNPLFVMVVVSLLGVTLLSVKIICVLCVYLSIGRKSLSRGRGGSIVISKTTVKDKYGWYYTFRKLTDGTLIIQQKNNLYDINNEMRIFGASHLDLLHEVMGHD